MNMEPVNRLKRDEALAAITLGDDEVRFLVGAYYQMQDNRIRNNNQIRATESSGEPNQVLTWLAAQNTILENQVKRALDKYTEDHKVGSWMRSHMGVGPVLSAGILAHIDIHKAPTAGHIWSFAGLVNGVRWEKGQKRPWNAELKKLFWLLGECFVKVSGKEDAFYGKIYAERKKLETDKNERGEYAEQAAAILNNGKRWDKTTDAYKAYIQGKLPPAHIHARAKRYAVKMFISHLHHVWYRIEFDRDPPKPFVVEHLGHAHIIRPPNFNL